jgi:multisubunit Na+/H+ antiporter MnhB subunit
VGNRFLVGLIVTVHFAFVAYVVVGGVLAIRWPWLFWPHFAAAVWGLSGLLIPLACPLTAAEDWARQRAGEAALTRGFLDRYITGVLFPARYTTPVVVLVGLIVAASWLMTYRQWGVHRSG